MGSDQPRAAPAPHTLRTASRRTRSPDHGYPPVDKRCARGDLAGVHIVFAQQAVAIERCGEDRVVRVLDGTELRARTVVIATGIEWRRLAVARLEELVGSGVFDGAAVSESRAMGDQDVFVVGAGNSAG
jgi:thioredoxin reductase (NADPH)